MGIANMDFIAKRLMECGKDPKTPLAFIEKGTTPYQRTVMATLETAGETIVRENVTAPAITISGWRRGTGQDACLGKRTCLCRESALW
jgi:Uroporphyrinogen-III methylase